MTPYHQRHATHRAAIASFDATRVATIEAARRTISKAADAAKAATDVELSRFAAEQDAIEAKVLADAHAKIAGPLAAHFENPSRPTAMAIAGVLRELAPALEGAIGGAGGYGVNVLTDLVWVAMARLVVSKDPMALGGVVAALVSPSPGNHPSDPSNKLHEAVMLGDPRTVEDALAALERSVSTAATSYRRGNSAQIVAQFDALCATRPGERRRRALAAVSAARKPADFAKLEAAQLERFNPFRKRPRGEPEPIPGGPLE